ncbi:MAG: PPC domain-containing protein, partial [Clostridiaceae bacterium]
IGYNGAYSTSTAYAMKPTFTAGSGSGDTYEPNDTTAEAYGISSGISYSSYIYSSTDVDYYKLTVSAAKSISISLTTLPKDYDLYLYNSSGTQVGRSINGGTTSESITYTAAAGTYYVKVIGYSSVYSTTAAYTLKATY